MKVLIDENLDQALRTMLGAHEALTVAYLGWTGLKNGDLLRAAESAGFDVLLTGDQTLSYEQNLTDRHIAVVALSAIQLPILRQAIPEIVGALDSATPGSVQVVNCGSFQRRHNRNKVE